MTSIDDVQTMRIRSTEDLLAAVPILLGFEPERSLVMVTTSAEVAFHARLDLPVTRRERREGVRALLGPARRHGVDEVILVAYSDDPLRVCLCAREMLPAFHRAGIDVRDVLRTDGARWFDVSPDPTDVVGPGVPYDVSSHAFRATAVAAGRVTWSSRAELSASVAADGEAVAAVGSARLRVGSTPRPTGEEVLLTCERLAAERARADPETAARLLLALDDPEVRDTMLGRLDRRAADRLVPVLSALVRAAPTDLVAPVASVLGFVAWLAGDGALAWCALDRSDEGGGCSLADRVAQALVLALPPTTWEQRTSARRTSDPVGGPPH